MSFDTLQELVMPPSHPVEAVTIEQFELFAQLTGVSLPLDYQHYLSLYGTGTIGGVVTPYNPWCRRPILKACYTLKDWMREALAIRDLQHTFGREVFPYPLYPEPGGVLPWGSTDNGDRLFWLTEGDPNEWMVLVNGARSSQFEIFPCSMSAFLVGIISGALLSEIIPSEGIDTLFDPQ